MRGNGISVKASGEAAAVGQATVGHRSESKAVEWSSAVETKGQDLCVETGRRVADLKARWVNKRTGQCQLVTSTVETKNGSSLPVGP